MLSALEHKEYAELVRKAQELAKRTSVCVAGYAGVAQHRDLSWMELESLSSLVGSLEETLECYGTVGVGK